MDRKFSSTELYARENNDLAIARAVERVKSRLVDAPPSVARDVMRRCNPAIHADLITWLEGVACPKSRRVPRAWSPGRRRSLWMLYKAADLDCPPHPPR